MSDLYKAVSALRVQDVNYIDADAVPMTDMGAYERPIVVLDGGVAVAVVIPLHLLNEVPE